MCPHKCPRINVAIQPFTPWVAISKRFGDVKIHVEHPVTDMLEITQGVKGWIDTLIETEKGWVILDHKSSPRPKSEWQQEAEEYSGQLATYRKAVASGGRNVTGVWAW